MPPWGSVGRGFSHRMPTFNGVYSTCLVVCPAGVPHGAHMGCHHTMHPGSIPSCVEWRNLYPTKMCPDEIYIYNPWRTLRALSSRETPHDVLPYCEWTMPPPVGYVMEIDIWGHSWGYVFGLIPRYTLYGIQLVFAF